MSKHGKILTANLLLTGDVVFYAQNGEWSARADEAFFAVSDNQIEFLEKVEAKGNAENIVVSTEIIPAEKSGLGTWPTRNRERIRAKGPTTHPNMGNQARFKLDQFEGS